MLVVPDATEWRGAAVGARGRGGETRADSVRAGLTAIPLDVEVVVVHDAARPLATAALFRAGDRRGARRGRRRGARGSRSPTRSSGSTVRVTATVDRKELVAVQTPQAFEPNILRAAHATSSDATDDAALVEAVGGKVVVVPGDPRNLKVTTRRSHDRRRPPRVVVSSSAHRTGGLVIRVGLGYDIHPFAPDASRPIVLGGVELPGPAGSIGHSDADAIAPRGRRRAARSGGLARSRLAVPCVRRHATAGASSLALLARRRRPGAPPTGGRS